MRIFVDLKSQVWNHSIYYLVLLPHNPSPFYLGGWLAPTTQNPSPFYLRGWLAPTTQNPSHFWVGGWLAPTSQNPSHFWVGMWLNPTKPVTLLSWGLAGASQVLIAVCDWFPTIHVAIWNLGLAGAKSTQIESNLVGWQGYWFVIGFPEIPSQKGLPGEMESFSQVWLLFFWGDWLQIRIANCDGISRNPITFRILGLG